MPLGTISSKLTSHKGAQARIYHDQLERALGAKVDGFYTGTVLPRNLWDYDNVYVYHGNDWSGTLNLFGGTEDTKLLNYLHSFSAIRDGTAVTSLGIKFPDYVALFMKRFKGKPTGAWEAIDFSSLEEIQLSAGFVKHIPISGDNNVVVGDSHAISLYRPGWRVNSIPYKTLHGALKVGVWDFVTEVAHHSVNDVELYFGNIDIRHHLCRFPEPKTQTDFLINDYLTQASNIAEKVGGKVYVCEPLPIENESRVVPKSGWYKGAPFYGSWQERNDIRLRFVDKLLEWSPKYGVEVKLWTDYLLNEKGELSFDHMEKPRSVHLALSSYPHWRGPADQPSALEGLFNA